MDDSAGNRRTAVELGRAGLAVTVANAAANLLAYLVPVLGARRLAPADLGVLAAAMALVAIAAMPGVGLQTAVAVATARGTAGPGTARLAWLTAAGCGGAVLLATPVLADALRLPAAVPPLLAAMTVPAVLAGWPLGALQGSERFGRLAAGMALLGAGRYAGVLVGLLAGADIVGVVALGALVAWSVPPALLWAARGAGAPESGGPAPAPSARLLRGRDVFTAASASLAILVVSYADLILARRLLSPDDSGAYAVGAVLTRAAIWAPQMVTVLALPRLARGRGRALAGGLALVGAAGALLVVATVVGAGPAVRGVGGDRYAALAGLAPYFVAVGALYAVSTFLLNAQLATGARWPAAGLWLVLAGLLATAAAVRPTTVGRLLACTLGAAVASVVALSIATWWQRRRRPAAALTAAR